MEVLLLLFWNKNQKKLDNVEAVAQLPKLSRKDQHEYQRKPDWMDSAGILSFVTNPQERVGNQKRLRDYYGLINRFCLPICISVGGKRL